MQVSPSHKSDLKHGRFAPGDLIGTRFRIVSLLGRGGMGEVYRADDLRLGQPVALKFLPPDVERDPDRLERFLSEVRTARQVSHPNVCRVYDLDEVDGHRFISMEYIDGEDLNSLLRRIGRLPEDKGLEIARQICGGLAAIHDRDILHRDLKPANVMIDGRGRARVTDFGLATLVADHEREIAGTVAYMSPEQLVGGALSARSDLYALGLVLFELFTGERVHSNDASPTVRAAERVTATTKMTASSGRMDPVVQRVITRCLDAAPAQRPPSALAVAGAIPGGDALAAALAAGDTPSPRLVAEADVEGSLAPRIAVPAVIAVVIGVLLFGWFSGRRNYSSVVDFPYSPQTLAVKAQEMLERLGHADAPVDTAFGFTRTTGAYLRWLGRDRPADWSGLADLRPQLVSFWYRTSPAPMVPRVFFGSTPGGAVTVTAADPPIAKAGMTYVEVSPDGRLMTLIVAPHEKEESPRTATEPDWSKAFVEAGLDVSAFTRVDSQWRPPHAVDARAAWLSSSASSVPLRVEGATRGGRVVFFRQIGPWTQPTDGTADAPRTTAQRVAYYATGFIVVSVTFVALALAIRNIRLGRADSRGATMVASAVGLIAVLGQAVSSRYGVLDTAVMVASWGLFLAALTWFAYIAIEPDVRRRNPAMLIAWNRLLEGRWRDPLVGRALLFGTLVGVGRALAIRMRAGFFEQSFPSVDTEAWPDFPTAVSVIFQHLTLTPLFPLMIIVLLIMLRSILRSEKAAAIAFVALFLVASPNAVPVDNVMLQAVFISIELFVGASIVWVATRVGYVAAMLALLIPNVLLSMNVSFPHPDFLRGIVLLGVALTLAPAVFGFATSLAREKTTTSWLD